MIFFFFSLPSVTPRPSGEGDHSLGRFLVMKLQVVCMLLTCILARPWLDKSWYDFCLCFGPRDPRRLQLLLVDFC